METILPSLFQVSENLGEGHPDRLCDLIAESIVDIVIANDPLAKVCLDVACKGNLVTILGNIELNNETNLDFEEIVKDCVRDIGYDNVDKGLSYKNLSIIIECEITMTKSKNKLSSKLPQGATVYGYATDEHDTESLTSTAHYISSSICSTLSELKSNKTLPWLYPDFSV